MEDFTHFIGIDWSGAKGPRHAGLAVAIMDMATKRVSPISPIDGYQNWSRRGIQEAIETRFGLSHQARLLIGIDSSFSFPWLDNEAYFPGDRLDDYARAFWAHVDTVCAADKHLGANLFVERYADHFLTSRVRGLRFKPRLRLTEERCNLMGMGRSESSFHLIGPSQVGLSALTTARMLNRLNGNDQIAIWPFDRNTAEKTVLVETFSTLHVRLLGHKGKVRDLATLKSIISAHNIHYDSGAKINDHQADAILTAVGLSKLAKQEKYWYPSGLSEMVKATEGWTFGVL